MRNLSVRLVYGRRSVGIAPNYRTGARFNGACTLLSIYLLSFEKNEWKNALNIEMEYQQKNGLQQL